MPTINMRSTATSVKGQGVGSVYEDQVSLVKSRLSSDFNITENRMGRFDIEHYHTINPTYYLNRIINRKSSSGICYVHFLPETVEQSIRLPRFFKKVFYKYILAFYNSMDYLVVVNPYMIDMLKEHGVTKPEQLCIPNFASSDMFYPLEKSETAALKEKYALPPDGFTVLGVGQLQTRKGIVDFVETAKQLPHIQFVWAGGFSFGKLNDGYEAINKIVKNPPENVRFLGIVDRSEMPGLYNLADIMFLPSYEELFPMAILEAHCCKTPVLLRDTEFYQAIFEDNYLKAKNVDGFVSILHDLSKIPEFLASQGEKAWDLRLKYGEEKILSQWRDLYERALIEKQNKRQADQNTMMKKIKQQTIQLEVLKKIKNQTHPSVVVTKIKKQYRQSFIVKRNKPDDL